MQSAGQPQQFQTTHWCLVVAAADRSSPGGEHALASLCGMYCYPLYAFVRRQGNPAAEAEDLTQDYFRRVPEKQYLRGVGPDKGRFRTLLLVCLQRLLATSPG